MSTTPKNNTVVDVVPTDFDVVSCPAIMIVLETLSAMVCG